VLFPLNLSKSATVIILCRTKSIPLVTVTSVVSLLTEQLCQQHQLAQQSRKPGYHTDMFKKRPNDWKFRLRCICKSHYELYCTVSHWLNYLHQNKISAMWNVRRKSNGFDQKSRLQHLDGFSK
jgi:hypothetical protein